VPPDTGPSKGCTALTHTTEWTKKLPPLRKDSSWLNRSTTDQPVLLNGDTQRTSELLCTDATTDSASLKRQRNESDASRPDPSTVTTVPPSSGPVHGDTSLTSTSDTSRCTPSDVKSTPFVVTSTDTYPGTDDSLLLHTTDVLLTYSARTDVVLKRQRWYP
jgi:hypothetical protein